MATPLLQTNESESEPDEAETSVNGLPIRIVKRTVQTQPNYTEEALLAGVEGTAVVYAEIAKDGSPENLRVLRSLGYIIPPLTGRKCPIARFPPRLTIRRGDALSRE